MGLDTKILLFVLALVLYRGLRGLRHGLSNPSTAALAVSIVSGILTGFVAQDAGIGRNNVVTAAWLGLVFALFVLGLALFVALLSEGDEPKTFLALDLKSSAGMFTAMFLSWGVALVAGIGF